MDHIERDEDKLTVADARTYVGTIVGRVAIYNGNECNFKIRNALYVPKMNKNLLWFGRSIGVASCKWCSTVRACAFRARI